MVKFSFKKPASSATTETAAKAPSAASGQVLHFFANFFNYFVVCLCFVVLAAGFWFIILPKYRFVQSNQQVVDEEAVYKQKLSYLKQLNEIKTLYATVSDDDQAGNDKGQDKEEKMLMPVKENACLIFYQVRLDAGIGLPKALLHFIPFLPGLFLFALAGQLACQAAAEKME